MPDRKLIRPALRDYKAGAREPREPREPQQEDGGAASAGFPSNRRKQVPPEQTNAENFYFLKQMSTKNLMVIVLEDGEELHGWIEWYDKDCIKVHRQNEPNLLVYKHSIKYLFKEREA